MEPVQVIGSFVSPFVRKVLVTLELKGIPYQVDPIPAFHAGDEFNRISPLRRIPVLTDDQVTLCDSSVICQYLEDRWPDAPVYPAGVVERARARWLEEYADTRLADVLVWKVFNQSVIVPHLWKKETDQSVLGHALEVEVPDVFGYLESQVPGSGYVCGAMSIADISIAAFFRNAAFARLKVDAARWPTLAAYVDRVLAHPAFQKLKAWEDKMMRTPVAHQREALVAMGAPLMDRSFYVETPRRGPMTVA